jgi:hypothetical protein
LKALEISKGITEYKKMKIENNIYTFLQFQSMNGKQKFLDALDIHPLRRCCINCCGNKKDIEHKYLGGQWPIVDSAVDPSLIKWENLGVGACGRRTRSLFVNLVAVIIVIVCFWAVSIIFNIRDNFNKASWSPADCGSNAKNI